MKKQFFTFLMMIALVIVAGSAMAQSTPKAPFQNATHSYKWSNVTANSYYYTVTTTATSPTADPAISGTHYSIASGSLGTVGSPLNTFSAFATTAVEIKWLVSTGDYYVWLVAESEDGCSNWRYVHVQPEANKVDFILATLGLFTKGESIATLTSASAKTLAAEIVGCPDPMLRDLANFESAGSSASSDGNVYVYFRVEQGAENNVDTWAFEFGVSTGSIEYYNGSAWTAYPASGGLTAIANGTKQLLRVMVPTPVSTGSVAAITGTISNAKEETTLLVDSDDTNDQKLFTVNRTAAIGDFDGE